MQCLTFYMKSGNKIVADKVTKFRVENNGNKVTSLLVEQKTKGIFKCKNELLISTIDLSQIECVTVK